MNEQAGSLIKSCRKFYVATIASMCVGLLCSCAATRTESRDTFTLHADSLRRTSQGTFEARGNVCIETTDFILYAPGFVYTPTNARVVFDGPVEIVITNRSHRENLEFLKNGMSRPVLLPDVSFDEAALPAIKEKTLPVINEMIASLGKAGERFPELRGLSNVQCADPFYGIIYSNKEKYGPDRKESIIQPGGCSVRLFIEPFERKDGATTEKTAKMYPYTEFVEMGIRFNYELRLGSPNPALETYFKMLVKKAIEQLAEIDQGFEK